MTKTDNPIDRHFQADDCLNCGAPLATDYCAACGQKRAKRFSGKTVISETWERLRLFEADFVKAALTVLWRPGAVARDYVLGIRKKHVHPLKLLLTAVVVLLLVVNQTGYLGVASASASRALEIVRTYAQWSFSLGVLAIFLAAVLTFWWDKPYRLIEYAILAIYTHFVVLVFNILNLSPLLLFGGADAIRTHRLWSSYYKDWIEGGIVLWAFAQFFQIGWKGEWWRLIIAALLFVALKKGVIQLGAQMLVHAIQAGWI